MKKLFILLSTVFILFSSQICHANLFGSSDNIADLKLQSGVTIPKASDLKPFTLTSTVIDKKTGKNKTFTEKDLQDQWTLIFFGFTNCPALCPTTMAQLANAYQELQKQKFSPMPQVVFISVDPERDTLEKIKLFVTTFNPAFIGARGDLNTVAQLSKELDVMFTKVPQKGLDKDKNSNYTIDHSGDIAVLNPKGQFVAMLTMPHKNEDIVKDYQTIVKAAQ